MTSPQELILASSSPRRREILAAVGAQFRIIPSQVPEVRMANEAPNAYVLRLAFEKARDVATRFKNAYVIGADTIVLIDGEVLEKPEDRNQAVHMLKKLAGRWHEVFTGVAVIDSLSNREAVDYCRTKVKFTSMTESEIEWYADTGEPMDKAGAYAIQGRGTLFIEEVEGNYLNVVGLPVTLLRRLLGSLGGKLV